MKLKILINIPSLTSQGIGFHFLYKFQYFQKNNCFLSLFNGNEIELLKKIDDPYTFNNKINLISRIEKFYFTKTNFLFFSLKKNLQAISKISPIIKSNYHVIYSPSSVLDLTIFPFILKIFQPQIVWATVFDNIVPITDPGDKLLRFLSWIFFKISLILIRRADIIFVSTPELMVFLKKNNFKNVLIQSMFGIENELIKKAKHNQKYKSDCLFVGRINETKGIYDLLKVTKEVRKTIPGFKLLIVGDGDEDTKKHFSKKIKENHLEKNIRILGYTVGQKKFDIIKSTKIFLFLSTSQHESFGMTLMEAVCSGIPAITYNLPPLKNIYQNHEIISYPKNDYQSVSKKVISILQNKKISNNQGRKLLKKYNWTDVSSNELKHIKIFLKNKND